MCEKVVVNWDGLPSIFRALHRLVYRLSRTRVVRLITGCRQKKENVAYPSRFEMAKPTVTMTIVANTDAGIPFFKKSLAPMYL